MTKIKEPTKQFCLALKTLKSCPSCVLKKVDKKDMKDTKKYDGFKKGTYRYVIRADIKGYYASISR